ncbi:MAG TPA: Hsp70 family protein [Tepidisphaeraceae bacterium]|jgi:molecular chaperone DnaK|nr:Hsp70 family protein [Tepidisphaeraceae bacterium]
MPLLGIDLGTTFSAMAYLDANGSPATILNAEGELTTPSVVLFDEDGEVIVGREARRAALAEPGRVAECAKRHMGDPYYPRLINGKRLSPISLSALILKKMRQDAERRLETSIDGAVITVPAYFDEGRRQATAEAGRLAGLRVIDIINEPTAAALAYAYRGILKENDAKPAQAGNKPAETPARTTLVYDLGGGTFDVTMLQIAGRDLRVLATAGDVRLGGRDWDERLFNHMADQFVHAHQDDPRDDPVSSQNLLLAAEETKKVLSLRKQTTFVVNHAGKTFSGEITRQQFDALTESLLYRSESRLNRVIKQAELTWDRIDDVLVVGGSTRMPQVIEMLRRVTGKEPNCTLSPDEAVAHGAAIHAAICAAGASARVAGAPKPQEPGPAAASPGAQTPEEKELDLVLTRPGLLASFKRGLLNLLRTIRTTNVNAYNLGVVVTTADKQQRVTILIPSNTQLPVSVKKRFGTASDNQAAVTVRIVEGESREPAECIAVGACSIEPLPRGLPRNSPVDVTFTYDNSGRLHVEAIEATYGNWASVAIKRQAGAARGTPMDEEPEVVATPVS